MRRPVPTPFVTRSSALLGAPAHDRLPVFLQSGFRPFFVLAGILGVALVPAVVLLLQSGVGRVGPLPLFTWHGHELVFGLVGAVLAGFLLTAPQVWTGGVTARGASLAGLVALFVAGRVVPLLPGPHGIGAAVNVAFFFALAFFVGRPIIRARSWRNLGFVVLLVALGIAQAVLWSAALGWLTWSWVGTAEWVALDAIALVIAIIGGRIIPGFTRNRLAGFEPRPPGWPDHLAKGTLVGLLVAHAAGASGPTLAAFLVVAGLAQLLRVRGWGLLRALREAPFLGALHLAYVLLGAGLVITALHPLAGRHLLTVGGIGLVCLAMMARVTLGHTGRPLQPPRAVLVALGLVALAAIARASWPLLDGAAASLALNGGAALWSLAFVLYLVALGPALFAPRVDGKIG